MSDLNNTGASDNADETNADYQKRTSVTVGEMRQQHGAQFAPGFQDSDRMGEVLANAGANTVEEFLERSSKR